MMMQLIYIAEDKCLYSCDLCLLFFLFFLTVILPNVMFGAKHRCDMKYQEFRRKVSHLFAVLSHIA